MVERYFDAFLYLANWGTRRLMFRLPRGVLDAEAAGLCCYTDAASVIETDDHLIVSLYADRDPDDDWEEPGGQLAAMVQARSELAAGDLRLLYLGWLLAVQSDEVDDEDTEPPVPSGLQEPERAASGDRRFPGDRRGPDRRGGGRQSSLATTRGWPGGSRLSRQGRRTRCSPGSPPVRAGRSRRCCCAVSVPLAARGWLRPAGRPPSCGRRPVTARPRGIRPRNGAGARSRPAEDAARTAAYARHLDQLATRTEEAWREAAALIETKRPRDYDRAVTLLRDLQALADRQGDLAVFTGRFGELRTRHQRKPSLLERFDQAGLPSRPAAGTWRLNWSARELPPGPIDRRDLSTRQRQRVALACSEIS